MENYLKPAIRPKNDSSPSYKTAVRTNGDFSPRNEKIPELWPRVVLKRLDQQECDEFARPVDLKRDNDGFLVPSAPNRMFKSEEEKRTTKKALSELADNLQSPEAFYFLKRYEEILEPFRKKSNPLLNGCINNPFLDRERKLQVVDWLQSANSEAPLPVPASVISAIPREVLQDYAASVISANSRTLFSSNQQKPKDTKAVYSLRDWTIVKGRDPIEVMVSGELMDITNETLMEEGHISSRILSADAVVVQTSCCIYHLNGNFVDSSNSIPNSIKKYFQNGKFPKEWREVIRLWTILNDKENSLYVREHNNRNTYNDADRDDGRRARPRPRENDRTYELEDKRILERIWGRGDMRLHDIEGHRTRVREDPRVHERDQRINETPERDNERIRGRIERLHERDENTFNERVQFREIDTLQEENNETARRDRRDINLSQLGRKRRNASPLEEESVLIRDVKRQRTEKVFHKRLATPGITRRTLILTRSARKKMMDSFLSTPKSSKRNTLKSRRKTPMPLRGRRIDSEIFDNSDLM